MNTLLLHTCCAPCASASIEYLLEKKIKPILFFSNNNIDTLEEYEKRFNEAKKLATLFNINLIADKYNHNEWLKKINGFENEPEKGKRCTICFSYSLLRTSVMAETLNIPCFTTTLTISIHKNSEQINNVGSQFKNYKPIDFKTNNGYNRSIELSKQYQLYRQKYCGCEFSKKPQR